ncbi:hypothetical protein M885DRAFT_559868 [Pelagophyceae sp. CCMP2097]|nr:hypothetical protein M885DRAFT_559868 [Pelagophyceae sp. CCMP2097]
MDAALHPVSARRGRVPASAVLASAIAVEAVCLYATTGSACAGASGDMHTDGFTTIWAYGGCIDLFNSSWVVGSYRAQLRAGGDRRRFAASALYTVQIGGGYLLMLVAMTYQVELLAAVVIGLATEHFLFHDDGAPEAPTGAPTEKTALLG